MRRVVVVSAVVLTVACGKSGVNPVKPDSGNYAPVIQSVTIDPATVPPGGMAAVRVAATDKDGDALTVTYRADVGAVTPDAAQPFLATYRAGTNNDVLHVTVADKYASASRDTPVAVVGATNPTTPTPEPTATPTTPTPAPTISLSGAASCYPIKAGNAGCDVTVAATATNYTTIAWGGCCSGSGTTGTCHVANPTSPYSCTATANGPGGTTAATPHAVSGVNAAPVIAGASMDPKRTLSCDEEATFTFAVTDEEGVWLCSSVQTAPEGVTVVSEQCPGVVPLEAKVKIRAWSPPRLAGSAHVVVKVKDPWQAESNAWDAIFGIADCP